MHTMLQASLSPHVHGLRKLQYESKAISSELEPTTATFSASSGPRQQQLQEKLQALQQCIDDKLALVRLSYNQSPWTHHRATLKVITHTGNDGVM